MIEIHQVDGCFYCAEHVPPGRAGPTARAAWDIPGAEGPICCRSCEKPLDCGCRTAGCLVYDEAEFPAADGPSIVDGWFSVERCDECRHYETDTEAGEEHLEETNVVCCLDDTFRELPDGIDRGSSCNDHFHRVFARGPKTAPARKQAERQVPRRVLGTDRTGHWVWQR